MTTARLRLPLRLSALLLAAAPSAWTCVCYESKGIEADYREAKAVLAGRVVALRIASRQVGRHTEDVTVATIRVERRWKGPKAREVEVQTCGTQEMICTCGTDFRLGDHFVVFAIGAPLETGSCQRTQRYDRVPEAGVLWNGVEDLVRELDVLSPGAR